MVFIEHILKEIFMCSVNRYLLLITFRQYTTVCMMLKGILPCFQALISQLLKLCM